MIRLVSIRVEGLSDLGPFEGELRFEPGLQVVSADNGFGKSLAVKAVAWCLGLEPMLGAPDNDPVCFPLAAYDELILDGQPAHVLQSTASITIAHLDGRTLRLTREIKGSDPKVVHVEEQSPTETKACNLNARHQSMQDLHGGLQRFLFDWLAWPRAQVFTFQGTTTDVYLENLAPLFYIEQTEGWTDLQARQITRYRQQQIAQVAVEYLLGALPAVQARHAQQWAILRSAALRESATVISAQAQNLFARYGWNVAWSAGGTIEEIANRWSKRSLADALRKDAEMDFASQRSLLEQKVEFLRKGVASEPIDPANSTAHSEASQKVLNLKRRRHEIAQELQVLRIQETQTEELLSSLDHRIHAAKDLLRLKATGVGRLDEVECPTCHRHLDPSTFGLNEQSTEAVSTHVEALKRDRDLMQRNIEGHRLRTRTLAAESTRVEADFRDAEAALAMVTAAIGTVREQISQATANVYDTQRQLDRMIDAAAELEAIQHAVDQWVLDARNAQESSDGSSDLGKRVESFVSALREYLIALGHSEVREANAASVHLDENYVPYRAERKLQALGSASDRSRLVAAYSLALAAASGRVTGLHPGLVLLDEPLQQNPDGKHQELFLAFLCKKLALQSSFQTVIFTYLEPHEIELLRTQGVRVVTPDGSHFLHLVPKEAPQAPEPSDEAPKA